MICFSQSCISVSLNMLRSEIWSLMRSCKSMVCCSCSSYWTVFIEGEGGVSFERVFCRQFCRRLLCWLIFNKILLKFYKILINTVRINYGECNTILRICNYSCSSEFLWLNCHSRRKYDYQWEELVVAITAFLTFSALLNNSSDY